VSESSRLRVAFVPGATPDKWATVWRERHRSIPLDLLPTPEERQFAVLEDGEADLCIARLPEGRASLPGDGFHCVLLYEEVQVAVAGKDHLIAAADEVALADLAEEQLVLPHHSGWTPDADQLAWPTSVCCCSALSDNVLDSRSFKPKRRSISSAASIAPYRLTYVQMRAENSPAASEPSTQAMAHIPDTIGTGQIFGTAKAMTLTNSATKSDHGRMAKNC
jgi:DNA-binding transcriptional LysR family regulator